MITDTELYEQSKRVLRASLTEEVVGDGSFILACHECGFAFPESTEMGMVAQHAELLHGFTGVEQLLLDLIWIGEGAPPEPKR